MATILMPPAAQSGDATLHITRECVDGSPLRGAAPRGQSVAPRHAGCAPAHHTSRAAARATTRRRMHRADRLPCARSAYHTAVVRCRSSKSLPGNLPSAEHAAPPPRARSPHRRTEHAAPRAAAAAPAAGTASGGFWCPLDDAAGFAAGFDAGCESDGDECTPLALVRDATYHNPLEADGFASGFARGAPAPAPAAPSKDAASILGRMDYAYGCPFEAPGFAEGFEAGYDSDADENATVSVLDRPGRMYDCPLEAYGFAEGFDSA